MPKPLALQRAEHALASVNGLPGTTEAEVGKYLAHVKGLPANILRSGLGQAMAMEKAGGGNDDGHRLLFEDIENWLLNRPARTRAPTQPADPPPPNGWGRSPYIVAGANPPSGLLQAIVSGNQDQYVRAQAEALAYLEWLKKFAVAFLESEEAAQSPALAQGGQE